MITPEIKDKVLCAIVESKETIFDLSYEDIFPNNEISKRHLHLILIQFVEKGLLRKVANNGSYFLLSVSADIYDFFNHGGFVAQEEILRANLQKLDYELTKLSQEIEPSLTDRISKITTIAASIATTLSLFRS